MYIAQRIFIWNSSCKIFLINIAHIYKTSAIFQTFTLRSYKRLLWVFVGFCAVIILNGLPESGALLLLVRTHLNLLRHWVAVDFDSA